MTEIHDRVFSKDGATTGCFDSVVLERYLRKAGRMREMQAECIGEFSYKVRREPVANGACIQGTEPRGSRQISRDDAGGDMLHISLVWHDGCGELSQGEGLCCRDLL